MSTLHARTSDHAPAPIRGERTAEWWMSLGHAVEELAERYPRTYGATIPASWRDDLETAEILASITRWRRELDQHDQPQHDEHNEAAGLDVLPFPVSGLERARQQWEWHAHRDQWLSRLSETGLTPLHAEQLEEAG